MEFNDLLRLIRDPGTIIAIAFFVSYLLIRVNRLERAIKFYTENLGITDRVVNELIKKVNGDKNARV